MIRPVRLRSMSGLRDTYNQIAKDWHKDHLKDTWWVEGVEKFIRLLAPGSTILDVGCGDGVRAQYLADHGFRVHGIDISEEMIKLSQQNCPSGVFELLDMTHLEQVMGTFDAIFAQASLLHAARAEAEKIVGMFASKLKKGGYCYIAVKASRENKPDEEDLVENDYGYPYQRFFSYYSREDIRRYFKASKLKIVSMTEVVLPRTTWIQMVGKKV